jgi:endonuclease/exonuclease/phosphatase family metal-dependent hydrolase
MSGAAAQARSAVGGLLGFGGGSPAGSYVPRVTSDVLVKTPGGTHMRALSGHYTTPTQDGGADTDQQVARVAATLGAWDGVTLLGADFNAESDSAPGQREREVFAKYGLSDAFSKAGIAIGDPARRSFGDGPRGGDIDRIYVSPHAQVNRAWVSSSQTSHGRGTDHEGVVADITLQPER